MKNYKMNVFAVETENSLVWNVTFPEIFGCGGAGDTPEAAIADANENLKVHLQFLEEENLPIPKPDNNLKTNEFSGKISLRIPKSLHKEITEIANKEGISVNQCLNYAISTFVGKENYKKSLFDEIRQDAGNLISNILEFNNQHMIMQKIKESWSNAKLGGWYGAK